MIRYGIEINLVKNPKTLQKEETQISIKKFKNKNIRK